MSTKLYYTRFIYTSITAFAFRERSEGIAVNVHRYVCLSVNISKTIGPIYLNIFTLSSSNMSQIGIQIL